MQAHRVAEDEGAEANRLTGSLGGVLIALALVVMGLWLFQHLRNKAEIEDCLLQGRMDCDRVLVEMARR
jgi:flagellar biogenesis protein FliO